MSSLEKKKKKKNIQYLNFKIKKKIRKKYFIR